jgi:hypothetical protein
MANKTIKKMKISLIMVLFVYILAPIVSSNEILGIDISISQNPIPCGGSTTAIATIKRTSLKHGELP